ncbi:MAG: S8 family serine peptidase, partial [Halalkalicoccus sp.]
MSDHRTRRLERRSFLGSLAAAIGAASLGGVAHATPGREPGPREDEVLVGVAASADDLEGTVEQHVPGNARVVHSNESLRYVAVKFPAQAPEHARENFIEAITKREHVRYAEPNVTYEALATNDPLWSEQYAPEMVGCPEAWSSTFGDPSITISIVDQGIQYDHPNLEAGYEDGYDFVDDDGDPYPVSEGENHGTHVGGIAGGRTDNGTGHAGISDCSLLSARALGEGGGGSLSDIADAITWSTDQGAEVINLSLGGGGYTETLKNAVSYALSNGSLPVAAAGNDGRNSVSYPAAYEECLAVSALDPDGSLAWYSNTGEEIELAAPGSDVLSTVNFDDYDEFSGTSMAAPVVSGVAGLALSTWDLSVSDLRLHLQATAEDIGLSDQEQGYGRVDAAAAVATDPDGGDGNDGGDDDDDDPTCGSRTETATVTDSLSGYWDADCWRYPWETDPCQVVVELVGPSDATFDLYVNEGGGCPTTSDYDYRSYT